MNGGWDGEMENKMVQIERWMEDEVDKIRVEWNEENWEMNGRWMEDEKEKMMNRR